MSTTPQPRRLALAAALVAGITALSVAAPAQAHPGRHHHRHHHHYGCAVTSTDGFAQPIAALGCRSLAQYLADHMAERLPDVLV